MNVWQSKIKQRSFLNRNPILKLKLLGFHTVDTTPLWLMCYCHNNLSSLFSNTEVGQFEGLFGYASSNVTITRTLSVQHSPWSFRFVYFSAWHFSAYRQLISLLQWWTSVWTCPPIRDGLLWRTSMTLISWEKLHLKWSSKYQIVWYRTRTHYEKYVSH